MRVMMSSRPIRLMAGIICMVLVAAPHRGCTASDADGVTSFVEVIRLDPGIRLDLRYATSSNFTGRVLYPQARAFLLRPVAESLVRANRRLAAQGYGLVIYDAYRPWSVTNYMWQVTPEEKRGFVAPPHPGSNHNRGAAADVGLYDLHTGLAVDMGSEFDEMTERSAFSYEGCTPQQKRMRAVLRDAMVAERFGTNRSEWWHFDYAGASRYPVRDYGFEELGQNNSAAEGGTGSRRRVPLVPAGLRGFGF